MATIDDIITNLNKAWADKQKLYNAAVAAAEGSGTTVQALLNKQGADKCTITELTNIIVNHPAAVLYAWGESTGNGYWYYNNLAHSGGRTTPNKDMTSGTRNWYNPCHTCGWQFKGPYNSSYSGGYVTINSAYVMMYFYNTNPSYPLVVGPVSSFSEYNCWYYGATGWYDSNDYGDSGKYYIYFIGIS